MSTPIKTLSFDQIYNLCNELGQPRYRADQLISWLFVKQANNYDEMIFVLGLSIAVALDQTPGPV